MKKRILIAQKLLLRGKIKNVLSRAHVCSLLEQRARNAHDQIEQTLHRGMLSTWETQRYHDSCGDIRSTLVVVRSQFFVISSTQSFLTFIYLFT